MVKILKNLNIIFVNIYIYLILISKHYELFLISLSTLEIVSKFFFNISPFDEFKRKH